MQFDDNKDATGILPSIFVATEHCVINPLIKKHKII
jgi:hypothetical protein